jgi:hypothetical protein
MTYANKLTFSYSHLGHLGSSILAPRLSKKPTWLLEHEGSSAKTARAETGRKGRIDWQNCMPALEDERQNDLPSKLMYCRELLAWNLEVFLQKDALKLMIWCTADTGKLTGLPSEIERSAWVTIKEVYHCHLESGAGGSSQPRYHPFRGRHRQGCWMNQHVSHRWSVNPFIVMTSP